MNFFPAICLATEFAGVMLCVTVKLDTANGKQPDLPPGARRLAIQLMTWPLVLIAAWAGLKLAGI